MSSGGAPPGRPGLLPLASSPPGAGSRGFSASLPARFLRKKKKGNSLRQERAAGQKTKLNRSGSAQQNLSEAGGDTQPGLPPVGVPPGVAPCPLATGVASLSRSRAHRDCPPPVPTREGLPLKLLHRQPGGDRGQPKRGDGVKTVAARPEPKRGDPRCRTHRHGWGAAGAGAGSQGGGVASEAGWFPWPHHACLSFFPLFFF